MSEFFTPEQLALLNTNNIPKHIAIIPDGNRRWAAIRDQGAAFGHQTGCDILLDVVEAASEIHIEHLTVYTFSTENWRRSKVEVDTLMQLLKAYLANQLPRMLAKGVRFNTIGDIDALPQDVVDVVNKCREETKDCDTIELILALNYGGRQEITRAIRKMMKDFELGRLSLSSINEEMVSRYLDTSQTPDPELLIRTSGEKRLSNYLLWQISYSEFYLTDIFWPDFRPQNLLEAVYEYQKRQRRLGGS